MVTRATTATCRCTSSAASARLRPSDINASAGSVEELERIVDRIRQRWPETEILIRASAPPW